MDEQKILDLLSALTGYHPSSFKQISSRDVKALTIKVYESQIDMDEYNVLINKAGNILKINNSDITFDHEMALNIQAAPQQPPQTAPITLTVTNNIPQFNSIKQQLDQISDELRNFAANYVSSNPGCILKLFDPSVRANINESSAATNSSWVFDEILCAGGVGYDYIANLRAENASDQSIADQITMSVHLDAALNVVEVEVEG